MLSSDCDLLRRPGYADLAIRPAFYGNCEAAGASKAYRKCGNRVGYRSARRWGARTCAAPRSRPVVKRRAEASPSLCSTVSGRAVDLDQHHDTKIVVDRGGGRCGRAGGSDGVGRHRRGDGWEPFRIASSTARTFVRRGYPLGCAAGRLAWRRPTPRRSGHVDGRSLQRNVTAPRAAGEIVLFDRNWYHLTSLKRVRGFCTDGEYREFLHDCSPLRGDADPFGNHPPQVVLFLVNDAEQEVRLRNGAHNPINGGMPSALDIASRRDWVGCFRAKDVWVAKTNRNIGSCY
jgi:Polyphosphate kinase 2 (PPK2)